MKIIAASQSEKTVLVQNADNSLSLWTPAQHMGGEIRKVFEIKGKKVLLSQKNIHWWRDRSKKAQFCEYYQHWMGDFPYGSWSWAIRLCKVTGTVDVQCIDTEINGRGINPSDRWVSECKSYAPKSIDAEVAC